MSLTRRPRFVAGSIDLALTYPALAWIPNDVTVGGSRTSAGGVPASYVVRRDSTLALTLRVTEAEWASFLALIAYGQTSQAFDWFPDANSSSGFLVYLEAPLAGDKLTPTRNSQYPRTFEVPITLRSTDGTPLWLPYFDT